VARQLPPGTFVRLTGKVTQYKNKLTMINPIHERIAQISNVKTPVLNPIYPETYGVSSLWIHAAIENVFSRLPADAFNDPLPEDIRKRYRLPSLKRALGAIHFSQNEKEAEGARKRFAFEEIFFIQLSRVAMRNERNAQGAAIIKIDGELFDAFRKSLPFALTGAQERVIGEICEDLKGVPRPLGAAAAFFSGSPAAPGSPKMPDEAKRFACVPSARLLQGDVGSGKTLVAAAAALHVTKNGYQTAYMAPTEILARQHFAEFCKRLGPFGVRVGLLTSSEALIFPSKIFKDTPAHLSKQQLFRKVRWGLVDIVLGTHALITKRKINFSFKNLAFVIVDEQHRFGINQRATLLQQDARRDTRDINNLVPHYLSMTATPIPRTLALTMYGDLDLSLLDEMPLGRMRVRTEVLKSSERGRAYEHASRCQRPVTRPRIVAGASGTRDGQRPERRRRNQIILVLRLKSYTLK
jgi:ATP-dependent DNA helicase RecG